jgi:hypothetical protein
VPFIVSSRGRPIGTTELDFIRILDANTVAEPEDLYSSSPYPLLRFRSGWFHPNSLGETLMPNVALMHSAVRAYISRDGRDADGQSIVAPDFRGSRMFADLAEAFQRIEAMDLTLHHADGTLIPTAQIGIQDTEQLRELGRLHALHAEPDLALDEEGEETEWDLDADLTFGDDLELPPGSWQPSDDEEEDDFDEIVRRAHEKLADLPRYQVHVELVDASAIL